MNFASIVLAAAEEEASGTDLLIPDLRELGAAVIAFGIVFFFIWKYAIPAFNEILENRAAAVKAELESAEAAKIEAESLKNDYQAQLAQARDEANRIVEEARQAGESVRAEVVSRGEAESAAIKQRATSDISGERDRMAAALNRDVADLSLEVAEKVIGSNLDRSAQQSLVDDYIDELGGLGA